jgi:hypothetical protein
MRVHAATPVLLLFISHIRASTMGTGELVEIMVRMPNRSLRKPRLWESIVRGYPKRSIPGT